MTSKPCYCSFGTKRGSGKPPQADALEKQPAVSQLRVCSTNQAFKSGSICPSSDFILCNESHAIVLLSMSLNPCTSKEQVNQAKPHKPLYVQFWQKVFRQPWRLQSSSLQQNSHKPRSSAAFPAPPGKRLAAEVGLGIGL